MERLRKAVNLGYRNLAALHDEEALGPLRDRPDFRLIMMDLAMPADVFRSEPPCVYEAAHRPQGGLVVHRGGSARGLVSPAGGLHREDLTSAEDPRPPRKAA